MISERHLFRMPYLMIIFIGLIETCLIEGSVTSLQHDI